MKIFVRKLLLSLVLAMGVSLLFSQEVLAATPRFTQATLRYDRMKQNTLSSLQVIIVPATTLVESKLKLVFGSATLGAGQSVSTAPVATGVGWSALALPGTLTAAGSGTSIVISGLTDLTVGTTYSINLTVGVSTGTAGAATDVITTLDAGSSAIDQTTITSRYIADDQVVITANVPPVFTFSLTGNTDAFSTDLSSSSIVATTGIGVSVSTNAAKGWTGWVKSANAALSSVTTGENIATTGSVDATPSVCQNGTDCYVLDADITTSGTGAGSLVIDPEYLGVGSSDGGTLSTSFQPFANRSGKTNGDKVTLVAKASIIATKAAGSDYTDTWTVVGAGNF